MSPTFTVKRGITQKHRCLPHTVLLDEISKGIDNMIEGNTNEESDGKQRNIDAQVQV
jgi:hypothetical protein